MGRPTKTLPTEDMMTKDTAMKAPAIKSPESENPEVESAAASDLTIGDFTIRDFTMNGSSRHSGSRRAVAIVGAVVTVALVLTLLATGLLVARGDRIFAANLRDGTATYFRTRGVALRVAADLPAGYAFDTILLGPDGIGGTGDDGTVPDALPDAGCGVTMDDATAPDQTPGSVASDRVRLRATCLGPRNASRTIEITLARARDPFVPGALYLDRPTIDASAPVVLAGGDHAPGDPAGQSTGPGHPVAAAAGAGLDMGIPLPPPVTDGSGGPVAVEPAPRMDDEAFSARMLAADVPLLADLSPTSLTAPVVHLPTDARLTSAAAGSGLLVVDGTLSIAAPFEFTGVVIVGGGLDIAPTGSVSVRGWLWVRGAGARVAVAAAGPLTVRFAADAVANADALVPLPRRAVPIGERES